MAYTAVLDIGGTGIKYGLVDDETGTLLETREVPTHAGEGGPALMRRVIALLHGFDGRFTRIGVSTCGQVDSESGSIIFATDNVPHYTGTKVKELLEAAFHVPAAVENDVNAAALGEAQFGAAKGFQNLLCVTYGTGIGGAIILNGALFTGSSGSAGEFGHFVTHKDGLPCTCGMRGCYEAYASTGALTRLAERETGRPQNGREIFAALAAHDDRIKRLVDGWTEEIAVGLAGLVHIFNPECIVLGGGIMREPYILGRLNTLLGRMVMPSFRGVKLVSAALGNSAGLMGAYHIARR